MADVTFAPVKVRPDDWGPPGGWRPRPFKATYTSTVTLLERELDMIGCTRALLQVDVDSRDVRLDGMLRADARPRHPGVILTVETRKHGTLIYDTDVFGHWHDNLRAIALGLEALRRVERYGIGSRGQQYAGYQELPAVAMSSGWTVESAAAFITEAILEAGGNDWSTEVKDDPSFALALYREAAELYHPDRAVLGDDGDPGVMAKLNTARDYLRAAFPDR